MTRTPSSPAASGELLFQAAMLRRVSRTFALTIPQLPDRLCDVVSNAYLLCRIADTIEDEPELSLRQKQAFSERLVEVVAGRDAPGPFAQDLASSLSSSTSAAERDLACGAARVLRITYGLRARQRRALERCLEIMTRGMVEFQRLATPGGLLDLAQMDRYCYCVAGVVAETLVELFCDYSSVIDERRDELLARSVSYGQGLQMTNILKDIWDDSRRGTCWLPRSVFEASGFDLQALSGGQAHPGFARGLAKLVAITRGHLVEGLRFILLIPARETGIRRHLLWTLGLSTLTLRRLHSTPSFRQGQEVTLSRSSIGTVMLLTSSLTRSDAALKLLFAAATRVLPRPEPTRRS
jgi:farnesyl-diphosphate farnesyltransferase